VEAHSPAQAELEYALNFDDLVALQAYLDARNRSFRNEALRLLIYFALLLTVAGVATLSTPAGRFQNGAPTVTGILALVGGCFLLSLLGFGCAYLSAGRERRARVRKLLRLPEVARALEPRQLRVAPDGVTTIDPLGAATSRWGAVREIATTNEHTFLITGEAGGFVVPRRAFRDEADFQAFVELARRYQTAAAADRVT
jgi:hypothetical protein